MKNCEFCGSKNASRAHFCSTCGEEFRIVEPVQTSSSASANGYDSDVQKRAPRAGRPLTPLERQNAYCPAPRHENVGNATSEFVSTVGSSLWAIFVAAAKWGVSLMKPLVRSVVSLVRDKFVYALSPSHSWDPRRPPNYLVWSVLDALLWRMPFSLVAIVYATLARDSLRRGEYQDAQARSEIAKNWLFFDFALGVVITVFRKLVFIN
ncbi:MAG: CD225/dispanin family protein [Planctomycetia bacterium]|nr:CD225/dispanin family protein [Planctomycetia bacterium]